MIGVVAVSYGMLTDNTLIFIIGLFFCLWWLPAHKKKNNQIHPEQSKILTLKHHTYDIFPSIIDGPVKSLLSLSFRVKREICKT